MTNVNKLSNEAAAAIWNQFGTQDPEQIRNLITSQLEQLLKNGEITEKDKDRAMKLIKSDKLIDALAGRNRTEGAMVDWVRGFEDLPDKTADTLMKEVGLEIPDLYDAAMLAKGDYTVQSSQLRKIKDVLNQKLQEKGSDRKLKKSEVRLLMQALGLNVSNTKGLMSKILNISQPLSLLLNLIPGVNVMAPKSIGYLVANKIVDENNGKKLEKIMDTLGLKAAQLEVEGNNVYINVQNQEVADALYSELQKENIPNVNVELDD